MYDEIFYYIKDNLKFDESNVVLEKKIIKYDYEYCVKIEIYDENYYKNVIINNVELEKIYSNEFDLFVQNILEKKYIYTQI